MSQNCRPLFRWSPPMATCYLTVPPGCFWALGLCTNNQHISSFRTKLGSLPHHDLHQCKWFAWFTHEWTGAMTWFDTKIDTDTMYNVYHFCSWFFCIYVISCSIFNTYISDPERQYFHRTWKLRLINWQIYGRYIYRCWFLGHAHEQEQELWALCWASILHQQMNGFIVFLLSKQHWTQQYVKCQY